MSKDDHQDALDCAIFVFCLIAISFGVIVIALAAFENPLVLMFATSPIWLAGVTYVCVRLYSWTTKKGKK